MRTARRALVAGLGTAPLLVALAAPGLAMTDHGRHVTRDDIAVTLDPYGTAHVVVDLDLDFGDEPGHGLYLTVPHRETTEDGRTRVYEVTGVAASSPSGAPDALRVEDDGNELQIYVGDDEIGDVDGTQTYRVEYTVTGLLNPDSTTGDGDQLYWDAVGPEFELPLDDVSVAVTGPADVERVQCYAGVPEVGAACTGAEQDGARATFRQDRLEPGDALTVVVGWPAGTFTGIEPAFDVEVPDDGMGDGSAGFGDLDGGFGVPDFDSAFSSTFRTGFFGAGMVVILGIGGVAALIAFGLWASRSGDRGAPPGPVRSLAERGYLRIDTVPGATGRTSWELHRLRAPDALLSPAELAWYQSIFGVGGVTAMARWADVTPPVLPEGRSVGVDLGVGGSSGFSSSSDFGGHDSGGSSGGGTGGGGGGAW